jgi:beta-lactamase class A
MIARRAVLGLGLGGLVAACSGRLATASPPPFAALESRVGGRLGVTALDTGNGRSIGWRQDERFAQCSSFKLSLAALVLDGARHGRWQLDERLHWRREDLLSNSPRTTANLDAGMTLGELARATLVTSDNTAANVLLRRLGGPPAMTAFWRALGDGTSRLDRYEPELNRVTPGSQLDTTTPAAMVRTLALLTTGDVLVPDDRALLLAWTMEVETGLRRLRAGFPRGWIAGDKTGTGLTPDGATYIDLAFGGPPGRAPLVIAAYYEPASPGDTVDPAAEAVLAECARIAVASFAI